MTDPRRRFSGAKLILLAGAHMLVLRRDFNPGIAWQGYLDLPGGGREDGEDPETCALRETEEELGLWLPKGRAKLVHLRHKPEGADWFYAMHMPARLRAEVRFGEEGAGWIALTPAEFVRRPDAIPHFRSIVAGYMRQRPVVGVSPRAVGPAGRVTRGASHPTAQRAPLLPARRCELRLRERPLRGR
ncbi:NUDIX domain-containing protein [Allosediminivita pacifica]|uniref:8-oxo-dGTP diphosphatase n=1 Tax=Allosediminivita pacifica TaxID=1267769 RepID=A0A2T6AZV4_9RHOB|nr:NUDIX domain-containing protein [Allosediminivita pacifica]PTX49293.1 8-oxo-dGTP diphosphatase [Allosediminivita pacifica]GGB05194.1 hypothetical protein GCM10011324_14160 [Allosediminivita pacifica]